MLGSLSSRSALLALLLAVASQALLLAWPSYVHVSNQRSLAALEVLRQGADIHGSPLDGAALEEKIRHERYLSGFYPEPVVEQLLTMPRVLVECLILQLWTLPFWCLLLVATVGRGEERMLVRLARSSSLAVAALSVVTLSLMILSIAGTATPVADAARAGLRIWITLLALSSIYLSGLVALPTGREGSAWKWSAYAGALLWFLWSARMGLRAVEAAAADYLPGGLERHLLSARPSEILLGVLVCAAFSVLFLVLGRMRIARRQGPLPIASLSTTSSRSDAT